MTHVRKPRSPLMEGNMQMRKGAGTRSVGRQIKKESQEDHKEEIDPQTTPSTLW